MDTGIREYCENMTVSIIEPNTDHNDENRYIIVALNEAGHNSTNVDLLDVIEWVKKIKPELLQDELEEKIEAARLEVKGDINKIDEQ